jgi:hypothetical protein
MNNSFSVDKTGLQLNNKPGCSLAKRGSKDDDLLKSLEKVETISVVAYCSN